MLSRTSRIRLSFFIGLLSWLLFVFFDIYQLFIQKYQMKIELSGFLPQLFFTIFIVATFFYYRMLIAKADSINFLDLLWRVFVTGLITTILSLGIRIFFSTFEENIISQNPITINFFYDVLMALIVVFLISTFVVWKRLILYQKSKNLIRFWRFFEYFLLGSLIFDLLGHKILSVNFNIALVFLTGFSLILSFNLKWIAYLNFKQKWKSILFILLSGVYIYHFLNTLDWFSKTGSLTLDMVDRVFIVSLFIFIIFYAIVTILVTLFNLPTSSVFEKKLQEAIDFQKLSLTPRGDSSLEETADLLLESSMSAVFADAAWIELKGDRPVLLQRGITKRQIKEVSERIHSQQAREIVSYLAKENNGALRVMSNVSSQEYKSILVLPIFVKHEQIGVLALLQEVTDAFNREMADIIVTFVNQASVSIENAQLLNEAIENERYKEQLNIAKSVQKSLLPDKLKHNDCFEILAYSIAADEVGGDYYDIIESDPNIFNLIIADVSGKGTSAAFNMAQMKGIFHGLALQNLSVLELTQQSNRALSKCLERSSFITASYFQINTNEKIISYCRAGHCPALIWKAQDQSCTFLDGKGLGLGILRNSEYHQYVEEKCIAYQSGDIILLYTDGIIEAKNREGELYGAPGLQKSLLNHINKSLEQIRSGLIEDLKEFLNGEKLDDDYTLTVLKFS